MIKLWQKFIQPKNILFLIALILLLAFGLHTVEFQHSHHEEIYGTGTQALMHGDDRKLWLILAVILFILSIAWARLFPKIYSSYMKHARINATVSNSFFVSKLFNPLIIAFRRGILHPKICE